MKRIVTVLAALVFTAALRGQQMDDPVSLPVSYYGEGMVNYASSQIFSFGSELGATSTFSGSFIPGGTTVFSPLTTTNVIPGKDYTVQVTSTNFSVVHVRFAAVPGYEIYLGPFAATTRLNSITLGTNYTFHFRLEAINDVTQSMADKRGGSASSLAEDKPIWFVGLGKLRSGRSAGAVGFRRSSFTADLYRTSALIYDSVDTAEVLVDRNGTTGYIESITSREVKVEVDAYNPTGTQYDIRVKRMNPDGTVGATFITYTVKQVGTNAGVLIIKNENSVYQATRLEVSGSTWTLYDWRTYNTTTQDFYDSTKRAVSVVSGNTTEVYYGGTDATTAPVVRKQKNYTTYGWGKELTSVKWGPTDTQPPTTSYTYYSSATGTGWPRSIESMVEPTGNWTKYDYFNTANDSKSGLVWRVYRPWLDAPTTPASATTGNSLVETYNYVANFDGTTTAPSSKITTINNTTVGQTTWTYNWGHVAANGRARYSVAQNDYSTSSNFLTTTTIAFRPDDSVGFFQGKPHCITRPDGTRDSFAYYYGTWNASTRVFTYSASGADRLVLALHGQSTNATGATMITVWTVGSNNWTVENTYMFANLSTISETVIDRTGHTVFSAENIFTGASSMERISGTARTYNSNNLLAKELDIARTAGSTEIAVNYTYTAGRIATRTDIDGTQTSYGYDNQLRVSSITSAVGGTGSYPAKTQTFTYNMADLKLTAKDCSCSPAVTTYNYEMTATGRLAYITEPKPATGGGLLTTLYTYNSPRQTTTTLPTSATLITNLYYDGRVKSELGTGQVATYHDYAVGNYTITKTTRNGSGTAYPWSQQITDGLGRVIQERTPQVGWTTSLSTKVVRKTYTYSTTTGQLTKVATTNEAASNARLLPDHLYTYGKLGRLEREGDDLGSNGALDAGLSDRITTYETLFYKDTAGYNGWVRQDFVRVYRTLGSAVDITTVSDKRTRYTRFNNGAVSPDGAVISDVGEIDASGSYVRVWEFAKPSTRTRKRDVERHGISQWAVTNWLDGYLKSETSMSGVTKTYAYNSLGLLDSVTSSGTNAVESYVYFPSTSVLQTLTRTTGSSSTTATNYAYFWKSTDSSETTAYKVRTTDGAGHISYLENDLRGLPVHEWGTAAKPASTTFDAFGRRTQLTTWRSGGPTGVLWGNPTGGDTITWTLDAATGAATKKEYPNSSSVNYAYNALGQAATRTWARGVTTTYYYYDGSGGAGGILTGELRKIDYGDTTTDVEFTYNRVGKKATVLDVAGSRTFAYGTDLLPTTESLDSFYGSKVMTTTYGTSVPGRVSGYSFNGSVTVSQTIGYSGTTGLISSVRGDSGATNTTFALGYATGTNWVSSVTNGLYTRTTPLETKYHVIKSATTTWNGTVLGNFVAKYTDARGIRSGQDSGSSSGTPAGSWSKVLNLGDGLKSNYTYSSYGELATAPTPTWQAAAGSQPLSGRNFGWTYDLAGNRTAETGIAASTYSLTDDVADKSWGSLNQYSSVSGVLAEANIKYDDDGNMTLDGTWTYTYDGENRLSGMSKSGTTMTFAYDYVGRRIGKTVNGTTTKFLWSGWKLAAELASDGSTVNKTFIWGPDFSDDQGNAGGAGSLLGQITGSTVAYAMPDALGNIAGYISGGVLAAAREYTPYGRVINQTGSFAAYPIGYSGQYTDSETGLVYYGLRYYNPKHGRFINRDPIEEAGGNNLYGFVGNAPSRAWDVLGLYCTRESWFEYQWDFGRGGDDQWGGRVVLHTSLNCSFDPPPSPMIFSGSYTRPQFATNLGWERDWRKFDPRSGLGGSILSVARPTGSQFGKVDFYRKPGTTPKRPPSRTRDMIFNDNGIDPETGLPTDGFGNPVLPGYPSGVDLRDIEALREKLEKMTPYERAVYERELAIEKATVGAVVTILATVVDPPLGTVLVVTGVGIAANGVYEAIQPLPSEEEWYRQHEKPPEQ